MESELTLKKIKALVTGGAGFIGSHLVDRMVANDYAVRVIDDLSTGKLANIQGHLNNGRVDFVKGDIRDKKLTQKTLQDINVVFHLAAITSVPFSVQNPALTTDVNVQGTLNLLGSSVKEKVDKLVFISSCAVYGEPNYLPVDEKHPTQPISPYAESKITAENACRNYHEKQLLQTTIFRLFNVYGPRQDHNEYSGVITRFFENCKQNLPLTIYGDGSQTRDFIHVHDAATTILSSSTQKAAEGQIFNLGSGKPTTIQNLACTILKMERKPVNITYSPPRPGDIKHSYADISKAKQLLDYTPRYALKKGLNTLIDEIA
jgi:UDP-glucose 4-epimerase